MSCQDQVWTNITKHTICGQQKHENIGKAYNVASVISHFNESVAACVSNHMS